MAVIASSTKSSLAAITALALASLSQAQVKGPLYVNGKKTGTAAFTFRIRPSGNVVEMSDIASSKTNSFQVAQTYGPDGTLITEVANASNGSQKVLVSIQFGASSAKVNVSAGGQVSHKAFPYPKGASLKQVDNLWFITVKPKVGATVSYSDLDLQTFRWKLKTSKYAGDEKVKYHGKLVNAHKVVSTDQIVWIDDHGYPYRLKVTNSDQLFERD